MTTEMQRARATAEKRQEAVQEALVAEHVRAVDEFTTTGFAEGERWSLGDAYGRLYLGMDLPIEELLDHADAITLAAAEHAQAARDAGQQIPFGTLVRAVFLDGFTEASFLWAARLDAAIREADRQAPTDWPPANVAGLAAIMRHDNAEQMNRQVPTDLADRQVPTDLAEVLTELADYITGEFTSAHALTLAGRAQELADMFDQAQNVAPTLKNEWTLFDTPNPVLAALAPGEYSLRLVNGRILARRLDVDRQASTWRDHDHERSR